MSQSHSNVSKSRLSVSARQPHWWKKWKSSANMSWIWSLSMFYTLSVFLFFSFCIKKILLLLSNESLCDGPTNGPAGRSPHFYSCFYDLNGMKLLFLWLLTSSQRFLFICFINQETFVSPQQQRNFSEMFLLFKIHNISNPKRIMMYSTQKCFFFWWYWNWQKWNVCFQFPNSY